ncbi:hypothetical protein [Fodinibius halophilus]|uniref:Secreted protein n=1 Tax=Fodinibius halophilus TaxID=1736908 RepID=A0A6M1T7M5_9BACT|nr:hypothetical protein [Fodinibius halophilus]NGP89405.1 hypothetical protein [Fodinibius halophilus]
MKKLSCFIVTLMFILFSFANIGNAQAEFLQDVEVSSCASDGGCEVIVRQYTGLVNAYSINVRCMDSSGNFGSWSNWSYSGIYSGSACNGEI